jgi:uncharacterized membrane protein (DUF106 family)
MAAVLDNFLGWLLAVHPAIAILIISLFVSIISSLGIKFFSDQKLMKSLRTEMNDMQKEMKLVKNNPKKMTKVNERLMEANSKYMMQSFRPMFFTIIPLFFVFGWMSTHMGYYPILPGEKFTVTAQFEKGTQGDIEINAPKGITVEGTPSQQILNDQAAWRMSGDKGEYNLTFNIKNDTYQMMVFITENRTYAPVSKSFQKKVVFFSMPEKNGLKTLKLSNKEITLFTDVFILRDIPIINGLNWFWGYILFSMVFSLGFKKLLNLY